mmetsp:Transcript_10888/g.36082  ORF Transcript_10888/g.36082 Transcript_10888/m.36082 type:complete len:262 (-) Transcript_10888:302-1087(-)
MCPCAMLCVVVCAPLTHDGDPYSRPPTNTLGFQLGSTDSIAALVGLQLRPRLRQHLLQRRHHTRLAVARAHDPRALVRPHCRKKLKLDQRRLGRAMDRHSERVRPDVHTHIASSRGRCTVARSPFWKHDADLHLLRSLRVPPTPRHRARLPPLHRATTHLLLRHRLLVLVHRGVIRRILRRSGPVKLGARVQLTQPEGRVAGGSRLDLYSRYEGIPVKRALHVEPAPSRDLRGALVDRKVLEDAHLVQIHVHPGVRQWHRA